MIKLDGTNKINIAVFISGSGTNLQNLIKFTKKKESKFKINLVVSNKPKAKGLIYAKKFKIYKKIIDFKKNSNAEKKILFYLKKRSVKIICLAGFMKILSKKFIKNFDGKILNIHPSLLPKYKGLNTHQRVIDNNEKFSGCTVHQVNSNLDSGKIILQKKVRVRKNDSSISLAKRVLKQEHLLYPKALLKIISNP